jgi:hypothetical protein
MIMIPSLFRNHRANRSSTPANAMYRNSVLLLALLLLPLSVLAGPGHDHGSETPAKTGTALPRFTAVSEQFELVGVVNGKQLTLYLDHADSNVPVKDAKLEVELAGKKLKLEAHGEGQFETTLAEALKPGVYPVTATVEAGKLSDLLAGELDLHEVTADAGNTHLGDWKKILTWGTGLAIALLLASWTFRNRKRITAGITRRNGGAA